MGMSPEKFRLKLNNENEFERDSMVVTGSISMNKTGGPGGGKKKTKKSGGVGGTTNLKRNKLAIAFNNIELEQKDNKQSDS